MAKVPIPVATHQYERTDAQLSAERKRALRAVRRAQRAWDTEIEKLERRIFEVLAKKTLVTRLNVGGIVFMYNLTIAKQKELESQLANFIEVALE